MAVLLPVDLRPSEDRPILQCLGRRLAEAVPGRENVPGFTRSTVDGYAVRAADTFGAAALIAFNLMVAPLLKFGGYRRIQTGALPVRAVISRSLASAPGREEYFRVRLQRRQGALWADPVLGKSGLLKPMVEADGLIRVPLASEGIAAGAEVDVVLFGTDYVL